MACHRQAGPVISWMGKTPPITGTTALSSGWYQHPTASWLMVRDCAPKEMEPVRSAPGLASTVTATEPVAMPELGTPTFIHETPGVAVQLQPLGARIPMVSDYQHTRDR